MSESYQVKIDAFEGPLDLLLHLINQYEIDIHDIPVATISEQYMHYIHTMQQLELNIASEYLVMAATLLAIKSKLLLPNQELEADSDEYEEDPRDELMRRLIEYRKYKEAAAQLKEKEDSTNRIYTRPPIVFEKMEKKSPVVQGDMSIYDMIAAMNKVFERKKWDKPFETKIQRSEIPIKQRMEEIVLELHNRTDGIAFFDLFSYPSRSHIVATFIAILELMKAREIYCVQKANFDDFIVYKIGG
ncbi:segregation/condensation protein A [Aquibacillus sp. 3ASR75-11]|uniref:Segregation and condensation protein A n=1 Tax=Terrihalobacillus insolitus TaxID=2950438 RepID=A0A9X4ANS6_9BACI|nr:segregation/condensation protein A [Terrihalobacillus insolitus]MDC3413096.1 segregation/condensation protein A [Terrihalobacillus insolitus]MDC3424838.1 segregation/condensation protein A [Terrihalobacillus insolitus]